MSFRALAAVLLALLPASAWPCDDGGLAVSMVGTLSGGRVLVREATSDDTFIALYVLDPARGVTTLLTTILEGNETAAEREKVRGEEWKKAQAELKKQGLVLQTLAVQRFPVTVGEVTLSSKADTDPESGCTEVTLLATRGKTTRTIDRTGYCGSSDTTSFSGVVLTPDGRYLIPIISSGCAEPASKWVKAFAVASLLEARKSGK